MRAFTKLGGLTLAVVGLTALSPATSRAQQELASVWKTSNDAAAQKLIDQGNRLLGDQKYADARIKYQSAVEMIRKKGEFPAQPLYEIASSYFYEGEPETAASHFTGIADEAAKYGDLATEAWALADAAWIYGQAGEKLNVEMELGRLNRLLTSPYLPKQVRDAIQSKEPGQATTLHMR